MELSPLQIASLLVLVLYLVAFFAGSALAARAAGQSIWLFGTATGRDRVAAFGFRAGFALAVIGPVVWVAVPGMSAADPLWSAGLALMALPGHVLAVAGAMLAFAAQMAMGASWRVGVKADAVGALVSEGLYSFSRNPTFLGQAALLAGVALAVPSVPGLLAVVLFIASANAQIRSEEDALKMSHGKAYEIFRDRTPRWLGRPKQSGPEI